VSANAVLCDGVVVGDVQALRETKRLTRVDGLFDALKAKREEWKRAHPGGAFPGVASFYFDQAEPAVVTKSVFQTTAFAGFPYGKLIVRRRDGTLGALAVDAMVPGPPRSASVAPKGPSMRQGATAVNGRLAPEIIQRVVRQNFGRFRKCYEAGLAKKPTLGGRVAARFVIDAQGAVRDSAIVESTMGEPAVEQCIAQGFSALTFPPPEGGIVTVVYPIVFAPGD
jgi:TonB family protein